MGGCKAALVRPTNRRIHLCIGEYRSIFHFTITVIY